MTEMSTRRTVYDPRDGEMSTIRLKAKNVSASKNDLIPATPDVQE